MPVAATAPRWGPTNTRT
ncbi:TPA_asm: UL9.5 iORF 2 [Human alphaherpesvirus 1]|nr:TPA_asm: UL9.5 iORF 2 [Human alphaherpesvirus 1]